MFTELVEKLHIEDVQFEDLYSVETDDIRRQMPVHGVIFLFKYGQVDRISASNGNLPLDGVYDADYQQKNIFFARQSIQNACATQAVLNVLLNTQVDLGPEIGDFRSFVAGFDSHMAGETISNSELIRLVHNSFSPPNMMVDENRPVSDSGHKDDGLFHFVGYVNIQNEIYELDGLKTYPIRHGPAHSPEEFAERLPEVLRRRIAKYGDELRFSLLAITNNKLLQFQNDNDVFGVENELTKRDAWKRENDLRRHDYTGLIVKLLGGISQVDDEEWNSVKSEARQAGLARALKERGRY